MTFPFDQIDNFNAGPNGEPRDREYFERLWAQGKARWPDIPMNVEAWCAHASLHADALLSVRETGQDHSEDFFLAAACSCGIPVAMSIMARDYLTDLSRAFRGMRVGDEERNDIAQRARAQILIGNEGRPPKISGYSGKGPLSAWVRVVTARIALSTLRGERSSATNEDEKIATLAADPLASHLYQTHREAFRLAVSSAMASLTAEERTLLRLHHIDGVSIDEFATMLNVHRSTAARRIARIREVLFERTKIGLIESLKLNPSEFGSIARALALEIDLSVHRLLRVHENDPPED